ncbi:MAG TPA: glycerophosphodiester phosphodiesterase family protein [Candidatus Binataceae bacterium]|nr:glycerophosphodiester phosphodiesterase family protein [Candidatus Binataceae bacterium]
MSARVLNIGHRGASKAFPENTLAAFRAAREAGADLCELDVQLSRDGAVVVIHDDTVDRTSNGHGAIANLTLAELQRLDAGRGERIPTLEEVFAATAGRCGLDVELKIAGLEPQVAAIMRKWNAAETSMVSSFDWDALEKMREIAPEIRLGVLASKNPARMLEAAARMHAYAVNPRFDLASRELCADAHARGFKVLVWTVDAPEAMGILIDADVDGIVTNYPERMRAVLGG